MHLLEKCPKTTASWMFIVASSIINFYCRFASGWFLTGDSICAFLSCWPGHLIILTKSVMIEVFFIDSFPLIRQFVVIVVVCVCVVLSCRDLSGMLSTVCSSTISSWVLTSEDTWEPLYVGHMRNATERGRLRLGLYLWCVKDLKSHSEKTLLHSKLRSIPGVSR